MEQYFLVKGEVFMYMELVMNIDQCSFKNLYQENGRAIWLDALF